MPALMNVRFHFGKRVVRYSSISVEYWYCSVMLSPRKTMRSPSLKKNCLGDSACSSPARRNSVRAATGRAKVRMDLVSKEVVDAAPVLIARRRLSSEFNVSVSLRKQNGYECHRKRYDAAIGYVVFVSIRRFSSQ